MEINRNSLTHNNLIWEHITNSLVVLKSCYPFFATYALIGLLLQIQFYDYFCFWKLFSCRNKNESYSEIKINNIVVRKCRHRHLKLYRLITSKIVFTEKKKNRSIHYTQSVDAKFDFTNVVCSRTLPNRYSPGNPKVSFSLCFSLTDYPSFSDSICPQKIAQKNNDKWPVISDNFCQLSRFF